MTSVNQAKSKKAPQTMAELLATYGKPIHGFSAGDKVKGKVIAKTSKSLVLDIGGKSEGVVTEKAFSEARDFIKNLKVGDEVVASVLIPETPDGVVILSLRQAAFDASWERLEKARNTGEEVAVLGKGVNQSGVTVDVEGLTGFIPGVQLGREVSKNPQGLIGKYFKTKVLGVDKLTNKIVLSEKEISEAGELKAAKETLSKVKEGEVYDGEVTTVANFGCFVKFKIGKIPLEGLVHVSELSWSKVENPSDVVRQQDKVKVKVIAVKDGKIALSIKRAQKDPWEGAEKKYKPETKLRGKVVKISDFGVFIELEPGVEGLVHMTKIPPATNLEEGQEIKVIVEEIDPKSKKLSLGLVLTSKPVGYK